MRRLSGSSASMARVARAHLMILARRVPAHYLLSPNPHTCAAASDDLELMASDALPTSISTSMNNAIGWGTRYALQTPNYRVPRPAAEPPGPTARAYKKAAAVCLVPGRVTLRCGKLSKPLRGKEIA